MNAASRYRCMDPTYWAERLDLAIGKDALHRSVFEVGDQQWAEITERRRKHLKVILPTDSVIDIGCAWGWNRDCMATTYRGFYTGIDICPQFLEMARERHPADLWFLMDARLLQYADNSFDVAVLGSIKGMLISHKGMDAWQEVEKEVSRVAKKLLILEYNE